MTAGAGTATVRVVIAIENIYPDTIEKTSAVVIAPPVPEEGDARDDWAYDHLFPATGTGRVDGDSCYVVTVVECDVPEVVGLMFEFGL